MGVAVSVGCVMSRSKATFTSRYSNRRNFLTLGLTLIDPRADRTRRTAFPRIPHEHVQPQPALGDHEQQRGLDHESGGGCGRGADCAIGWRQQQAGADIDGEGSGIGDGAGSRPVGRPGTGAI